MTSGAPPPPSDSAAATESRGLSTAALLTVALFVGGAAGLAETAVLAVARYGLGRFTHLNPHFAYLSPLWYMTAVLVVISPLLLLSRRARTSVRMTIAVFPVVLVGSLGVFFLYARLSRWSALALAAGIAIQATRVAMGRASTVCTLARRGLPVLGTAIVGLVIALNVPGAVAEWRALSRLAPDPTKPNVLLIIWDTVRAASLSVYGYGRPTTPTLERLAREGVVFDRAYAVSPWTLPSHASLFTGLPFAELSTDWRSPLDDTPPTLAALSADNGYATGGFVANYYYCSRESGLARGFLRYEDYPTPSGSQFALGSAVSRAFFNSWKLRGALGFVDKPGRKEAHDVNREFLTWVERLDGKPFFAFLNYFDAHAPYLPPAPWDTMFGPPLPGRDPSMREGRTFTPRELQAEIDAYDGGIRSLDDHLGLIIEELDRLGQLENTIIVVTSDHGEEFGEHGVFTHGNTLYERSLHVPLLIRAPGRSPGGLHVGDWVSIRDVAPTIAALAGLAPGIGGRSLERYWTSWSPANTAIARDRPDTLIAQVSYARGLPATYPVSAGDMQTILASPHQFIRGGDGREQLFDLTDSVTALQDLAGRAEMSAVMTAMRGYLHRTLLDTAVVTIRAVGEPQQQ